MVHHRTAWAPIYAANVALKRPIEADGGDHEFLIRWLLRKGLRSQLRRQGGRCGQGESQKDLADLALSSGVCPVTPAAPATEIPRTSTMGPSRVNQRRALVDSVIATATGWPPQPPVSGHSPGSFVAQQRRQKQEAYYGVGVGALCWNRLVGCVVWHTVQSRNVPICACILTNLMPSFGSRLGAMAWGLSWQAAQ